MSFSYDNTLASDRDWVRFLLSDTVEADATLTDEEIDAVLLETANKYCAAVLLGGTMVGRWTVAGAGVVEKRVGDLSITYGSGESASGAFGDYLKGLRAKCLAAQMPRPRVFRVL